MLCNIFVSGAVIKCWRFQSSQHETVNAMVRHDLSCHTSSPFTCRCASPADVFSAYRVCHNICLLA